MKVAFLGDLHIGASSNNKAIWANQKRFIFEQFIPYIRENKIDRVIQTGDFFDNRTAIPHQVMHNGQWVAEQISHHAKFVVLVGNHDVPYKSSNQFDAVDALLGGINDDVQTVMWPSVVFGEFLVVPWVSPANEASVNDFIKTTDRKYLVGHFDVIGGKFNKHGIASEHGFDPKTFSRFDRVISGHYHTKSTIGKVDFVGVPYELDWNDWNDPKGFHVLDTDTNELTFIENDRRIFYKVQQTSEGIAYTTPTKDPGESFEGCFVKIEANADDKAAARRIIDSVGEAASVQTILTKPRETVTIESVETKSVTEALLEAASNCSRPDAVTRILARAIEKNKTI